MSLETLRAELVRYLQEWDVPARAGWPGKGMGERQEPVVAVTLKQGRLGPAGFQNYLGEEWDPEKGQWTERYGRKAELVFGLDIYGGGRTGEADLQAAFDRMARALRCRKCHRACSLRGCWCRSSPAGRRSMTAGAGG